MADFQSVAKVNYCGRIRDSKFKRLPIVYGHCAMTVAWMSVIFHIPTSKYTSIIIDLKNA